jgi:hypothetical protein
MIILGILVERLITYLDDNWVNPGRLLKKIENWILSGYPKKKKEIDDRMDERLLVTGLITGVKNR